jgi:phosphonate degradation associated HDIG domain protein
MTLTIDGIFDAFERHGASNYGERVSQLEHMLQSAELAMEDGASDALIIAALLHDIGHFEWPEPEDAENLTVDRAHEVIAARALATLFAPEVWRPVALHVAAKRYLCATEPGYLQGLSPASLASLRVQGGAFTAAQAVRFEKTPYAQDAIRLRRYDDGAKRVDYKAKPLSSYRDGMAKLECRLQQ